MRRLCFVLISALLAAPLVSASPAAALGSMECALTSDETDLNEGPTDYDHALRPEGALRGVMLFAEFPDAPGGVATSSLYELQVPGAAEYYEAQSYGRLSLVVDTPVDDWVEMPSVASTYDIGTYEGQLRLLEDIIAATDPVVDFSPYDLVYVVTPPSGTGYELSPAMVFYPGTGVVADGNELRHGATFGQDIDRGFMLLVHETGHAFGAPDLYDYAAIEAGTNYHAHVGAWDPMGQLDGGAGFMTWHRNKFGWLVDEEVLCIDSPAHGTTVLSPAEGPGGLKSIVVRTSASTAYVIENRAPIGYDAVLCDPGILIYRVDADAASGAGPIVVRRAKEAPDDLACDVTPSADPETIPAAFDVGAGEVSVFEDAAAQLRVTVLSSDGFDRQIEVDFDGPGYAPPPTEHGRTVTLSALNRRLVLKGNVASTDDFESCHAFVPVKLQKKRYTRWRTVGTGTTGEAGTFALQLPSNGTFRVKAPTLTIGDDDICTAARSGPIRA